MTFQINLEQHATSLLAPYVRNLIIECGVLRLIYQGCFLSSIRTVLLQITPALPKVLDEDWIARFALKTKDGRFRESVAALILVDSSPIRKIVRIFYRSLLALVRFPLNVTQYKVLYNARVALRRPYYPYNTEGSSKGALIGDEISLDLSALSLIEQVHNVFRCGTNLTQITRHLSDVGGAVFFVFSGAVTGA